MRVFGDVTGNYPEDPIRFLDFETYRNLGDDNLDFFYGDARTNVHSYHVPNRRKVIFHTEEQFSPQDSTDQFVPIVDEILTICPPWVTGRAKRKAVFFPFNPSMVPPAGSCEKKWEVIYTGFAPGGHVVDMLSTIRRYNYRLVSFGGLLEGVTDVGISYREKMVRIAESRACVVHNLVSPDNPQLKTRPFEAASCGSAMLCMRDRWNLIEEWFTPWEHFLYFDNETQLRALIEDVNANWEKHLPMVERARQKAFENYTVEQFVRRYLA